jgi:hypothetical protein
MLMRFAERPRRFVGEGIVSSNDNIAGRIRFAPMLPAVASGDDMEPRLRRDRLRAVQRPRSGSLRPAGRPRADRGGQESAAGPAPLRRSALAAPIYKFPTIQELEFEWESEIDRGSRDYIKWVQRSLNQLLGLKLAVDGVSGTMTRSAVRSFQARYGLSADGIVGPQTEAALTRAGASKPPGASPSMPAPSSPWQSPTPSPPDSRASASKLSGEHWVQQFPTSRSTDSLAEPFRSNVKRFLDALGRAGAKIEISATRRPAERAWLMHYAWMIAEEGLSPAAVPTHPNIDIQWVHTDASGNVDLAASRAAAADMVRGYGLQYEPALDSLHIDGRAIDMTISWSGSLRIRDRKGTLVTIASTPQTGSDNRELHGVGAT